MGLLPDLPMDDSALDLYWRALHPGPGFERSSIGDTLDLLAEMAGSDPNAIEEVLDDGENGGPRLVVMRDPIYHPNDLISALIEEVRRLRETAGLERIGWAHQDAEGRWFFHAEDADHLGCRPAWVRAGEDKIGPNSNRPCSNYTARKWSPLSPVPEDDTCVNCGRSAATCPANRRVTEAGED